MKHRKFSILFVLIAALALSLGFVACSSNGDDTHTHSYVNYIYNNDATCVKDGTETAKCENCNETDTRKKMDSATGEHIYEMYLCVTCHAVAPDAPITEGLCYELNEGYFVSKGSAENNEFINIPAVYNGKPVIGIAPLHSLIVVA